MKPLSAVRHLSSVVCLLVSVLCGHADTVVSNKTVANAELYQVQDLVLVTTANTVLVQSGGTATFRSSGSLTLQPGFTVSSGGFFHASIAQSFSVPLAWMPLGGASGYNVYRNGTLLNGSALTVTTYTDATAQPGTTYSYVIKSITGGVETTLVTYTVASAGALEVFTPLP